MTGSGAQTPGTTLFTLDAFGQVTSIGYSGGTTGNKSYIHDSAGQGIVSSSNVNGVPSTDN